jgi:hypothetical protein
MNRLEVAVCQGVLRNSCTDPRFKEERRLLVSFAVGPWQACGIEAQEAFNLKMADTDAMSVQNDPLRIELEILIVQMYEGRAPASLLTKLVLEKLFAASILEDWRSATT